MANQFTCPECGFRADAAAFMMDRSARESLMAALNMPPALSRRIMGYLGLFRPTKRALTWDRVEKLLSDLLPYITENRVERNGVVWAAPLSYWEAGFDQILSKREQLQLPLKSHGYLFEIIAGMSSKQAAKAEQEIEEKRRHTPADRGSQKGMQSIGAVLDQSARPDHKVKTKKTKAKPPENWRSQVNIPGAKKDG